MIVDCAVYEEGRRRAGELRLEDAYDAGRDGDAFVWLGLHEPSQEEFDSVKREFELHELAVEDAIKAHQRPKLEVYGDTLFMVLKTVRYVDPEEIIDIGELQLFVGEDFVVSVRHGEGSSLGEARRGIESRPDLLRCGPSAVLHAIVDRVVDDYQPVLEGVDRDIEEIEQEVFSSSRHNPAGRIYKLTREVLEFNRAVAPLLGPLDRLARGQLLLVHDEVLPYFRDVHDHASRAVGQVDGFRVLLAGALQANLTQVSVRQNEDTRKISAWVAIVAVPTMIAGVYGMNFEHMPELRWSFGYPLVVGLMLLVCSLLYRSFRRSGWL